MPIRYDVPVNECALCGHLGIAESNKSSERCPSRSCRSALWNGGQSLSRQKSKSHHPTLPEPPRSRVRAADVVAATGGRVTVASKLPPVAERGCPAMDRAAASPRPGRGIAPPSAASFLWPRENRITGTWSGALSRPPDDRWRDQ
jgi:hypothetical protein